MNIVYMGTPEFAVPALEALIKHHNVTAVITQPDTKKGRGHKFVPTPVKEIAIKHNIPVYQPEKLRDKAFIEVLKQIPAEVFVVCAYGQILSKAVLGMPKLGCINIHGSLLPKYRGAAPIHSAVMNGDKKTGVTIMQMDSGIDTGDMIYKMEFDIAPEDNLGTVHDRMSVIGAEAVIHALSQIEKGEAVFTPQDSEDSSGSYAHKITKETGLIDWSHDADAIINLIRGLNPFPGAYSYIDGNCIKIYKAEKYPFEKNLEQDDASNSSMQSGIILEADKKRGLIVSVGNGAILITEIQPPGGKRMSCADYLRGHTISIGQKIGAIVI